MKCPKCNSEEKSKNGFVGKNKDISVNVNIYNQSHKKGKSTK